MATGDGWLVELDPSACPRGNEGDSSRGQSHNCAWVWGLAEGWPLSPWGWKEYSWAHQALFEVSDDLSQCTCLLSAPQFPPLRSWCRSVCAQREKVMVVKFFDCTNN